MGRSYDDLFFQSLSTDIGWDTLPKHSHIALLCVLILGTIFRLLLLDLVPVNYDSGYYLYDALQILDGERPIVDYFSRSPLFHYLLAGALALGFDPLVTGRIVMIFASAAVGASAYLVAARLHSKEAGLFAAALFSFSPLMLIWGQWIKTEQFAATIGLLGAALILPRLSDERIAMRYPAILGVLLGIGFLIRRTTIAYLGLLVAFVWAYRLNTQQPSSLRELYAHRRSVLLETAVGAVAVGSFAVTVLFGYAFLAGFQPEVLRRVFQAHFVHWLPGLSDGGPNTANGVYQSGVLDLLFLFCRGCDERTVQILSQAFFVTLPSAVVLYACFSSYVHRTLATLPDSRRTKYVIVGTVAFAVVASFQIASVTTMLLGLYAVFGFGIAFSVLLWGLSTVGVDIKWLYEAAETNLRLESAFVVLFVLVWFSNLFPRLQVYGVPQPVWVGILTVLALVALLLLTQHLPRKQIASRLNVELGAVAGVGVGLLLLYLMRDRVVFVGYFQEIYPFLVVLVGGGLAAVAEVGRVRRSVKFLVVTSVVLATVIPAVAGVYLAAGHGGVQNPYNPDDLGTVSGIHGVGDYIQGASEPDDVILTGMPLYAIEADRKNAQDLSRLYWWTTIFPDVERTQQLLTTLQKSMATGEIRYVVVEERLQATFDAHPELRQTFQANFCRVADAEATFRPQNAHLYEYCGEGNE